MKHSWQGWNNSNDHLRDRLSEVSFTFLDKTSRTLFKLNAALLPSQNDN